MAEEGSTKSGEGQDPFEALSAKMYEDDQRKWTEADARWQTAIPAERLRMLANAIAQCGSLERQLGLVSSFANLLGRLDLERNAELRPVEKDLLDRIKHRLEHSLAVRVEILGMLCHFHMGEDDREAEKERGITSLIAVFARLSEADYPRPPRPRSYLPPSETGCMGCDGGGGVIFRDEENEIVYGSSRT